MIICYVATDPNHNLSKLLKQSDKLVLKFYREMERKVRVVKTILEKMTKLQNTQYLALRCIIKSQ